MYIVERMPHETDTPLNKAVSKVMEEGYNLFAIFLQGSQNYNLDGPESDFDYKAYVIPSYHDLLEEKKVTKTYEITGVGQVEVKDVRLLLDLIRKGNPAYIEVLASRSKYIVDKFGWKVLSMSLEKIAHLNRDAVFKATQGMARQKEKLLFKERPGNQKDFEKFGYDPKNLSHLIRIEHFMKRVRNRDIEPKEWYFIGDDEKGVRKEILEAKNIPQKKTEVYKCAQEKLDNILTMFDTELEHLEKNKALKKQMEHHMENAKYIIHNIIREEHQKVGGFSLGETKAKNPL